MPSATRDTAGLGFTTLRDCHLLWHAFPGISRSSSLSLCGPTTPETPKCFRFRLFRVRSPLLTESRLISLPVGTEMCHFPTFAEPFPMDSGKANPGCPGLGCPIRGSPDKLVCSTPGLFAAYHALHRLSAPRHPPYTLCNLPTLIRFPEDNTLAKPDARRLTAAQRGARNRTRLASTSRTATTVQQYISSDVKTPRLSLITHLQFSKSAQQNSSSPARSSGTKTPDLVAGAGFEPATSGL